MKQDSKPLYKALMARDQRFDGLFFVGVASTGIYCRPICPVKPPKEVNCRLQKLLLPAAFQVCAVSTTHLSPVMGCRPHVCASRRLKMPASPMVRARQPCSFPIVRLMTGRGYWPFLRLASSRVSNG